MDPKENGARIISTGSDKRLCRNSEKCVSEIRLKPLTVPQNGNRALVNSSHLIVELQLLIEDNSKASDPRGEPRNRVPKRNGRNCTLQLYHC